MDWQKNLLQKDRTHYFKYPEFSGIFTINDHISDTSIQINIKVIFTVYEYIIIYQYILLSNVIYIYICYHEKNVSSRLSPQWLCSNSFTWAHDVRLHITGTNEPKSAQQAKQGV